MQKSQDRGRAATGAPLSPIVLETMGAHRQRLIASLTDWLGPADAEDVLQEACLKALRQAGNLRNHDSAVRWFERIVRHTAIDHARHMRAERRVHITVARDPTYLQQNEMAELREAICRCGVALISALRPSYGDVLRRVDLGGEQIADVAAALASSPNNIRVRLHRARSALSARILAFCGLCAERKGRFCTCDGDRRAAASP